MGEITSPGKYNIIQVCQIFDYLQEEIKYTQEPPGEDNWLSPIETLKNCSGDCEDFAMLFSALVTAKGGTARIYMTDNHAFAAVYIGDKKNAAALFQDIESYYGVNLFFAVFEDEFGYWLVADPLGSFYLGGLPANSNANGPPKENNLYSWGFVKTAFIKKSGKTVQVIDVMRE